MTALTLLEKIYGAYTSRAQEAFQNILRSIGSGLKVNLKFMGETDRGWINVSISGEDEVVATNFLNKEFGLAPCSLKNLKSGTIIRGKIIDSGIVGFGIYVDIGIFSPEPLDALIPLHKLRTQLLGGKILSTRQIIDLFCLHDYFPLEIRITDIRPEKHEIEAELSDKQISTINKWISSALERVIVIGSLPDYLESILHKIKHRQDVVRVEKLGFLELSIVCKSGTEAPGLIAAIGPHLYGVPLYAFQPQKILNKISG